MDFFEFRNNKELSEAFRPALYRYVSNLMSLKDEKHHTIVSPLNDYIDQELYEVRRWINLPSHKIDSESGYESCGEMDKDYFRVDNFYYKVTKKGYRRLKDIGFKDPPKCRFLGELLKVIV